MGGLAYPGEFAVLAICAGLMLALQRVLRFLPPAVRLRRAVPVVIGLLLVGIGGGRLADMAGFAAKQGPAEYLMFASGLLLWVLGVTKLFRRL
jgi:xanthine/uracil permease